MQRFGFILLLIIFFACKKEKSNPCDATVAANLPAVSIDSVYRDNDDRIIVTGNVLGAGQDDAGLTAHGVVWSQNLTPSLQNGQSKDLGAASGTGRFTVTLDSLPPGDYQFRTYATNCTGTQYSSTVKNLMVTVQGKPFVQVNDHYLISATGNDGIINPGDDVQYGFTVQNVGTLKADAVTATLYTAATQYIGNLSPASLNIGVLNAGGAISGAQTVSFKVAGNTPPGQYCLNVDIDAGGETNPDTICFEVVQTVTADFSVANDSCKAPCTLTFTSTAQGATSHLWRFGDGNTATGASVTHEYTKGGSYLVKLEVTGPGGTQKKEKTIFIDYHKFFSSFGNSDVDEGGFEILFINNGYKILTSVADINIPDGINLALWNADRQGIITETSSFQFYGIYVDNYPDHNNDIMILLTSIWRGVFIKKLYNTGGIDNTFEFPLSSFSHVPLSIIEDIDNSGYIIGSDSSGIEFLFHTNANGGIIDSVSFAVSPNFISKGILLKSSNGYCALSGYYNNSSDQLTFKRLDAALNILTEEEFPGIKLSKAVLSPDNKMFILGDENQVVKIWKMDLNGTILGAWAPNFSGDISLSEITVSDDLNIIVAGKTTTNAGDIFMAKINASNGSVLWQYNYGDPSREESVNKLSLAPDGGFILTGESYKDSNADYDVFLLKTDANGKHN